MTVETIHIVRHGFRLTHELHAKSPTGTRLDFVLTAYGVEQARELAAYFAPDDGRSASDGSSSIERPQVIYSSPLYRCLQTATPLADTLDLPILVEHGLSEFYLAVKKGFHPRTLEAARLAQHCSRVAPELHQSMVYPSQKGESIADLHARAKDVLSKLIAKIERDDAEDRVKCVIIFSHAATIIAMGRALVGDDELMVRTGTASISTYKRIASKSSHALGSWQQRSNGDTSFLKGGEERHWEFSYIEEYEDEGILPDPSEQDLVSSSLSHPSKL